MVEVGPQQGNDISDRMCRHIISCAFVLTCSLGSTAGRAAAQDPPAPPMAAGFAIPRPWDSVVDRQSQPPAAEAGQSPAPSESDAAAAGERSSERGEDHVETDRDAFTPAMRLVGKGLFVLESAYSYIDNPGIPATHSYPEMLLRFGLLERLEVRLGWNYEVGGGGNDVSGEQGGDEFDVRRLLRDSRINYGVKAALTRQAGWVPDSIVMAQVFTPTSGPSSATQMVATGACGWKLPNRWRLDAALRYGTNSEGGDHFGVWAPSAVLRARWRALGRPCGILRIVLAGPGHELRATCRESRDSLPGHSQSGAGRARRLGLERPVAAFLQQCRLRLAFLS